MHERLGKTRNAVFAAAVSASLALSPAAAASTPSSPESINSSQVSADAQSLGVASNGARTLVWRQSFGPVDSPTANTVQARRTNFRTITTTTGSGRNRRTVTTTQTINTPLTVWSGATDGRFVSEVVSATTPSGVTTVAWTVNDPTGNKVTVLARRIDAAGRLGTLLELAPSGTRAHDLRVASGSNGNSLVLWRTDDTQVSWVVARRIDPASNLGTVTELTPDHGSYFEVEPAGRADGSFEVVWRNGNGANPMTQSVHVTPSGTPGAPHDLASPSAFCNDDQTIVMGANGIASVAWTEWNGTSNSLRFTRINAAGNHWAPITVTTTANPYHPALAVSADGTATVTWVYSASGSYRARLTRVAPNWTVAKVVELGPAGESLIAGFGPSLAVAPDGTATATWTSARPGQFPQSVYLQAVKVAPNGTKTATSNVVTPAQGVGDLEHGARLAVAPDGTALISYLRRSLFGGPSLLKLSTWK